MKNNIFFKILQILCEFKHYIPEDYFENEFKLFVPSIDHSTEYYEVSFFIHNFLFYINENKCNNIKEFVRLKFQGIKYIIDNVFFSENTKNKNVYMIGKANRINSAFTKLAIQYKIKRTKPKIETDLILMPLSIYDKSTISIVENNSVYLFKNLDILKLINESLTQTDNFFINSKFPCNPYTNLPFTYSTLYNFYFLLKNSYLPFSNLFHEFFLCNFNIPKFTLFNEFIIREYSFKQFIKNEFIDKQITEIKFMLKENSWSKKWVIHKDFPHKDLLTIFKPILIYYLRCQYGNNDCSLYYESKEKLRYYLEQMYKHNPCFGRKIFVSQKKTFYFNKKMLTFKELKNKPIPSPSARPISSAIMTFNYNELIELMNTPIGDNLFRNITNIDNNSNISEEFYDDYTYDPISDNDYEDEYEGNDEGNDGDNQDEEDDENTNTAI